MALAYTAPTWTDGSGEGISASNLQAISNCLEGLVQGSDKAIHNITFSGSTMTFTFADGTQETYVTSVKGISSISKTGSSGLVDTYTITYSDGTTTSFTVTNGDDGAQGPEGPEGPQGPSGADGEDGYSPEVTITTITGGHRVTITDADHPQGQSFDVMDGSGGGASAMSDLTDVTLTSLANNQILKYDNSASKWKNANLPTVDQTYNSASTNAQSGTAVAGAIVGKQDADDKMDASDMAEVLTPLPSARGNWIEYSTTEQRVGTWISGKPVYQKTVDCGALPNNTTKNVAHNISNLDFVVDMSGIATNTTTHSSRKLDMISTSSAANCVACIISRTNISLSTGGNVSAYNQTYVTVQYTKTTD